MGYRQVRVPPFSERVRVAPFTKRVKEAVTVRQRVPPYHATVRVPPYSERVRVAPFSVLVTGSYERTETYCARYEVVVGQSVCVQWATRTVTVTYSEWVTAYHYETRPAYHYEVREVFHYQNRTEYRWVTRDVYHYEIRPVYHYRQVPVYGEVERTRWVCGSGYVLDDASDPPLCDPDPTTTTEPPSGGCVTAWGVLGAGSRSAPGAWDSGCASVHQGSAQVPYHARRYSFSLDAAASVTVGVSSAADAYVYLADDAGTVLFEDDDSGTGADALLSSLSLSAGDYVVEATTAAPRSTGSFTVTVTVTGTAPADVTISGFADADATPAAGTAAATVTDTISVTPHDATCTAAPAGATVDPAAGASRTVSHDVAAGTTQTVTVECALGASSDTARARFTAHPAPQAVVPDVEITGLDDVTATPAAGAVSVEISDEFTVTPADAVCLPYATRGTATITPTAGTTRTVSLEVTAGTREYVVIRCTNSNDHYRTAVARFTANHTPITAAQPENLDATVGTELRRIWIYQPGAATAAITSTLPDGITATINAAQGFATLTITATRTGEYDIDITYTNGTATLTTTTTVTAQCRAGHTQTPTGSCIPELGCGPDSLQGTSGPWGRFTQYGVWSSVCPSAVIQGSVARFYQLDIPLTTRFGATEFRPSRIDLGLSRRSICP